MAGGSRLRITEESLELQQFMHSTQQSIEESRASHDEHRKAISELSKQYNQITEMLKALMQKEQIPVAGDGVLGASGQPIAIQARTTPNTAPIPAKDARSMSHAVGGSHELSDRSYSWNSDGRGRALRIPKLEFPTFEGTKPRSWIRKCNRYFNVFGIQESQKIEIAAMNVNGRADTWLQGVLLQNPSISWTELSEIVCVRFSDKQGSDLVEDFNKLKHKDELEDYNEKFEELRACMLLSSDPHLPEQYFVSSYLSGLKTEIKSLVKLSRPTTLAMAFEQARFYNSAVQGIDKLSKSPWKAGISYFSPTVPALEPMPFLEEETSTSQNSSEFFSLDPQVGDLGLELTEASITEVAVANALRRTESEEESQVQVEPPKAKRILLYAALVPLLAAIAIMVLYMTIYFRECFSDGLGLHCFIMFGSFATATLIALALNLGQMRGFRWLQRLCFLSRGHPALRGLAFALGVVACIPVSFTRPITFRATLAAILMFVWGYMIDVATDLDLGLSGVFSAVLVSIGLVSVAPTTFRSSRKDDNAAWLIVVGFLLGGVSSWSLGWTKRRFFC